MGAGAGATGAGGGAAGAGAAAVGVGAGGVGAGAGATDRARTGGGDSASARSDTCHRASCHDTVDGCGATSGCAPLAPFRSRIAAWFAAPAMDDLLVDASALVTAALTAVDAATAATSAMRARTAPPVVRAYETPLSAWWWFADRGQCMHSPDGARQALTVLARRYRVCDRCVVPKVLVGPGFSSRVCVLSVVITERSGRRRVPPPPAVSVFRALSSYAVSRSAPAT